MGRPFSVPRIAVVSTGATCGCMLRGTKTAFPGESTISTHIVGAIGAKGTVCIGSTPRFIDACMGEHLPISSCGRNVVASPHRMNNLPRCGNAPIISASNSNVPSI